MGGGEKIINKIVVSSPRNIPGQLYTCIPGSVNLTSSFPKEIPKHCPIEMASVDADSTKNLTRMAKPEHFPDISAVADERGSFTLSIMFHIAELVEFMTKVGTCLHPRELSTMKEKWCWILNVSWFTTHKQTLGLALCWIRICTVLKVVPSPKFLADSEH